MWRAILVVVVMAASTAEAQPMRLPEPRDPERERALLVGACLAAFQEAYRLSDAELATATQAQASCKQAPGATLYKLKGGAVFEWGPSPTGSVAGTPPRR